MGKLAITGGEKTIKIEGPHFIWPPITNRTVQAVLHQLNDSISIYDKSGIFAEFEDRFAEYHNRKYGLLTNSGTEALHTMYVATQLEQGDQVIFPAYTFFATATPIFQTGAIPILADSNSDGNIDPGDLESRITQNTKAIVVTHMWGIPCNMYELTQIVDKYGILLLEDCSHAHGSKFQGKNVGTFGNSAVWSLQAQKTVTGGEGGILLTDNDEIFYRSLLFGHYNKRCRNEIPQDHPLSRFSVTGMGLKLRSHPLAIAIAMEQFDNLDEYLEGREQNARIMMEQLGTLPGLNMPQLREGDSFSWYAFVMNYKPEELEGLPIKTFYDAVVAEGAIELDRPGSTRPLNLHPLFQDPSPLFPSYKGRVSYRHGDFPNAEKFHATSLKLPVWHNNLEMTKIYIDSIIKVVENYKELLQ